MNAGAAAIEEVADAVLQALDERRQCEPFSGRVAGFDLDAAYGVTAALRTRREARGERQIGRKIGFTNRGIWEQYNVDRPIWGDVYDTTLRDTARSGARLPLVGFMEPLIEPEIVFRLASAPNPSMDERELLGCIDWAAFGFEIVQSIYPGWKFTAADAIAAGGLHGVLAVGRPQRVGMASAESWRDAFAEFTVRLFRGKTETDQGRGANVLDSPLSALRHLVGVLAADRVNPPLRAGEIITTGTLTKALPIAPGQTWSIAVSGIDLDGISVTFG